MENVLDVLRERGFVQDVTDETELHTRLESPITLYNGIDATANSLHLGHLVSVMALRWYQRYGHRPIALVGGGTTLIGDPTGRQSSRPILTRDEIQENVEGIRSQLNHFLDFSDGKALLLNNADWLTDLNYVDFMRDIGSRFTVNDLLRLEAYRARLEAGGLTFLEFSYALMQSYDFLRLYEDYDTILQIGGSDQWGNSVAGADLIRRVTGGEVFVAVSPLITTSSGTKMGKTAGNAVWLDPTRTSPYEYYQYWRNVDDSMVRICLGIFTELPMEEVRRLAQLEGAELNGAKEILAFEATALLHGVDEARGAQDAARALFAGEGSGDSIPAVEISRARLEAGLRVTDLFKDAGLVSSANEARNLIRSRGLSINDEPITDPFATVSFSQGGNEHLKLSRGRKQHKRVVLI